MYVRSIKIRKNKFVTCMENLELYVQAFVMSVTFLCLKERFETVAG